MENKRNFIKRDRVDSNKIPTIKDTYDRMSKEKRNLRKDEPFVLMFRNFIFFDVKSYECRNGDLYIRNIVDGIILKRYFRMDGDDQLTVFKNREEFDVFMKKVEEEGYHLGPDKPIMFGKKPGLVYKVLQDSDSGIHGLLTKSSDEFALENYSACRDSVTGKIDLIISSWDGVSFTRDECPDFFDRIVKILEANPDSAQISTRNDFM